MKIFFGLYIVIGSIYTIIIYSYGKFTEVINKINDNDFPLISGLGYADKCILLVFICILTWPWRLYNKIRNKLK